MTDTDILAELKDSQGNLPNDRIAEAIPILEAHITKAMRSGIAPDGMELLAALEAHMGSSHRYMVALIMDLANEQREMWNFIGKMAGNKGRRPKNTERDLEQIIDSLRFAKLMGLYALMVSKGYSPSGLIVPGKS